MTYVFFNPSDVCEHKKSGERASSAAFGKNRLIYSKWPPNYQICEKNDILAKNIN